MNSINLNIPAIESTFDVTDGTEGMNFFDKQYTTIISTITLVGAMFACLFGGKLVSLPQVTASDWIRKVESPYGN